MGSCGFGGEADPAESFQFGLSLVLRAENQKNKS